MKKERKSIISPFAILTAVIFITVGILFILSDINPTIADCLNDGICQKFRQIMSWIGSLTSGSLIEIVILLIPIIVFLVIKGALKQNSLRDKIRYLINIVCVILLILSGHLMALGIAHNTTPISDKMSLSEVEVSEDNLADVLTMLRDEINLLAEEMPRDSDGVFRSQRTIGQISEEICLSYDKLALDYNIPKGYDSRAKEVFFSDVMSYLAISGIYTYPTGEANVNMNYPSYVNIFTAAHEMSHQRGILRENEANFLAYLITITSDDSELRYSGLMNMYNYFASALYRTNKERYFSIHRELNSFSRADYAESSRVSDKFGDTIIEEISEKINDFYLKSSGTADGVVSYSRVVTLVLSYHSKNQ